MVTKNSTAFERIGGHSLMPRVVQKKRWKKNIKKKERQGQVTKGRGFGSRHLEHLEPERIAQENPTLTSKFPKTVFEFGL